MQRAIVGILATVSACAATPSQSESMNPGFFVGVCPSAVAMPDTLTPLKVLMTQIDWADRHYEPNIRVLGHVVARVTIDTTGRVEPGSVIIEASDKPALSVSYCRDLLRQRFTPYRLDGVARRVRVNQDLRMVRTLRP